MGIKLSREQEKLFETLLFLIKLLIFAIPLYVVLNFQGILLPLQEVVSQNVYFVLKSLGFEVLRVDFLLRAGEIAFFISEDCTGWKSMLFLAALMFAVPGVLMKKRLLGLAVGIPIIYVGNLLRILIMVFIWEAYGYEFAMLMHGYFWQFGLISLVLIVWVSWLVWAGKVKITFLKRLHKLIKPR
ncbi:MAG: exosortase/archaeosortase family protein [Candidatus Aenigmarchaeota archaeon]|nr:exosortase/archaeosortase family protein [Candidatus Aenigmarchaeota archaeon]